MGLVSSANWSVSEEVSVESGGGEGAVACLVPRAAAGEVPLLVPTSGREGVDPGLAPTRMRLSVCLFVPIDKHQLLQHDRMANFLSSSQKIVLSEIGNCLPKLLFWAACDVSHRHGPTPHLQSL